MAAHLGPPYLVADALPVRVDFFVKKFKQPRWEELVVLYTGLLWGSRRLKRTKENNINFNMKQLEITLLKLRV